MYRMLIVDDEEFITDSLYYFFQEREELELEAFRAYSAKEALELADKYLFDIILSDICMPGMSGTELMHLIKKRWPACKFIFFTGHREFEYTYEALKYRDVYYLLKTESYNSILCTVQSCVKDLDEQFSGKVMLADLERKAENNRQIIQDELARQLISGEYTANRALFADAAYDPTAPSYLLLARTDGRIDAKLADHIELYQYIGRLIGQNIPEGISLSGCFKTCEMVWILQCGDEGVDLANILNELIGMISSRVQASYDQIMSFAYGSGTPCAAVSGLYAHLSRRLYEIQLNETGAVIRLDADEHPGPSAYDDMWDLLMRGDTGGFLAAYDEHMRWVNELDLDKQLSREYYRFLLKYVDYMNASGLGDKLYADMDALLVPKSAWHEALERIRDDAARYQKLREAARSRDTNETVRHIVDYIRDHYHTDLTLTSVAEHFHFNAAYLSRLFKNTTGQNFQHHLNDVRLEQACRMLDARTHKVNEIAQAVGFGSSKYFISVFRKYKGVTPQEWRNLKGL